ncbi:MAG TPA: alpha/beta hydrolase [Bauldia sp.]|nr:alpha/beta hydrolase [Bauldia sp.]
MGNSDAAAGDVLAELDPDVRRYLAMLKSGPAVPMARENIAAMRAAARALRDGWRKPLPEMHSVGDAFWEGLRYRHYRPAGVKTLPAIIYLHGGGWTLMDIETHDAIARNLAQASGAALLQIEYPLAPEAPFPAALEACIGFAEFVRNSADELGIAADRIGFAGDSAGANLAVAMALQLRDRGAWQAGALGLFYGCYDADFERPSMRLYGDGAHFAFTLERLRFLLDCYVPEPEQRTDPLFAVINADLRNLPRSFLAVASHDILRDENLVMAERLTAAGGAVDCRVYPGTIHGFIEAWSAAGATIAKAALDDVGSFLRDRLV